MRPAARTSGKPARGRRRSRPTTATSRWPAHASRGWSQQRRVVLISRLGNELLEGDVLADCVPGVIEQGVRQRPHHATVAVSKGANRRQVQQEEADEQDGVVPALGNRFLVPVEHFDSEVFRARRGNGNEPGLNRPSGDRSTTRLSLSLNRPPGSVVCAKSSRCRCSNMPTFSGRQSSPKT